MDCLPLNSRERSRWGIGWVPPGLGCHFLVPSKGPLSLTQLTTQLSGQRQEGGPRALGRARSVPQARLAGPGLSPGGRGPSPRVLLPDSSAVTTALTAFQRGRGFLQPSPHLPAHPRQEILRQRARERDSEKSMPPDKSWSPERALESKTSPSTRRRKPLGKGSPWQTQLAFSEC